jgi:hypothetical protein
LTENVAAGTGLAVGVGAERTKTRAPRRHAEAWRQGSVEAGKRGGREAWRQGSVEAEAGEAEMPRGAEAEVVRDAMGITPAEGAGRGRAGGS